MHKEEFNKFKNNLSLDEFREYVYHHTDSEIVEAYGISHGNLRELRKEFNLYTPKEITQLKRKNTWKNKTEKSLQDLVSKVNKEDLIQYYEIENHYLDETAEYFGLSNGEFIKLINYFDIHKSTESHVKNIKKSKLDKYGDENYNNRGKAEETCIDRYGVCNPSQNEDVLKKMRNTWESHGFDHPMHVDEIKQKVIDSTVLYNNDSIPNKHFSELFTSNNIEFKQEKILSKFRYDFQIGSNFIEINPSATHNSTWGIFGEPKEKDYHYNKTKLAKDNGYRCINVWDWDDENKIISLLLPRETIYARKCTLKEVDKLEAKKFIDDYHLQGYTKDNIRLGLYYNDELVSIMTFDKPRYNKNYEYELIRYCSSKKVIGGAEKLFKHFIIKYNPKAVISYCDYSKFTGNTYIKLGFNFKNVSVGCHWYNPKTKRHITDNLLRARGVDQLLGTNYGKGTDNKELMRLNGFVEIYDAGQAVYEWRSD